MKQDKVVLAILVITILMFIAQLTKNYMLFAYTMPTLIFSFIFLGSISRNRLPKVLAIGWGVMYLVVLSSLLSMLNIVQIPENITKDLVFGLPKATVILLGVFWAFTGLATTAFYAFRFDKDILPQEVMDEYSKKIKK